MNEILQETQEMLHEAHEQLAGYVGLSGPERAVASEHWFRQQITKALEPLIARIVRLETKPAPAPIAGKPPKEFISAIGQLVADELKPLREHIMHLEKTIEKLEQRKYVGVWATGKYHEGNMVTLDGSIFHCNAAETTQRPGTGPDWTLAIKRGQDASRQPTGERSYGRG